MTFTKKVYKANSDGSIGLTVPHNATGPNGEPIEPGDAVTFRVVKVEKQGGRGE
jgi:hypothetical protein